VSGLFGAWSLTGDPIERALAVGQREQMRAAGRRAGGAAHRELAGGRLWLSAPQAEVVEGNHTAIAGTGVFAGDGLRSALAAGITPEGHFSVIRHDRVADTLVLYRSQSGGERLYVAPLGGGVIGFATSIWPLIAVVGARLERTVLDEVLLTGLTMTGTESLHEGISEVLPGHEVTLGDAMSPQRLRHPEILRAPVGDPATLAREFRRHLTEAVAAGAGPDRPVCVALSGGIDSSAIAAAAVDAFGADAVHAITYEFDDVGHSTEVGYAKQVADKLGIRRHHVFPLRVDDYLQAIPEMVYRSESLVHWPKAFMLLVAREVKRLGHDRYLTGFGIGSHMGYLDELSRGLRHGSHPVLAPWKTSRFTHRRWPDLLARLHPAFEPPHPRLYYLLVRLLAARGSIRDVASMYPGDVAPLVRAPRSIDAERAVPLVTWLQRQAFARGIACIDVTRSEKASRELGVYRVSPAHFDRCIPYAHFPIEPRPRLYSTARTLRPGKLLLRLAYRGILPDDVLYRVKSWGDAVASDRWLRAGRRLMLGVLPGFPGDLAGYGEHYPAAVRAWESRSILASSLALRLWMRMFVELPQADSPPTWQSLWASLSEARRCA